MTIFLRQEAPIPACDSFLIGWLGSTKNVSKTVSNKARRHIVQMHMNLFGCLAHDMPCATCPWNTPEQQLDLELLYKRLLFWSCWSLYSIRRNCNSIMQHVPQEARNYSNNGWNCRCSGNKLRMEWNHLNSSSIETFNSLSPKDTNIQRLSRDRTTTALKMFNISLIWIYGHKLSVQDGHMFLNDECSEAAMLFM